MLTKEKVQEILEEVFSDYVRVEDADAQKVYDGLMEMLSEQAVEHTLAPDGAYLCGKCGLMSRTTKCENCGHIYKRPAGKA